MNEEDRPGPPKPPGRIIEAQEPGDRARHKAALSIEKKKRDHTDQGWQGNR